MDLFWVSSESILIFLSIYFKLLLVYFESPPLIYFGLLLDIFWISPWYILHYFWVYFEWFLGLCTWQSDWHLLATWSTIFLTILWLFSLLIFSKVKWAILNILFGYKNVNCFTSSTLNIVMGWEKCVSHTEINPSKPPNLLCSWLIISVNHFIHSHEHISNYISKALLAFIWERFDLPFLDWKKSTPHFRSPELLNVYSQKCCIRSSFTNIICSPWKTFQGILFQLSSVYVS